MSELEPIGNHEVQTLAEQQLRETLQIDESLLQEPLYRVPFKALCDCWTENENHRDNPDYTQERDFLFRYARAMTADKSSYNKIAFENGQDDAANYIETFDEIEAENAQIETYRKFEDTELTARMQELINETAPESLLGQIREKMRITHDQEKPFEVLVLNASLGQEHNDGQSQAKSEWDEVVGLYAEAFVQETNDGKRFLILQSQTVEDLLGSEEDSKRHAQGIISHEYFHTQRKLRFGKGTEFGRALDEHMAISLSGSGGHPDARIIIKTIFNSCTPEEQTLLLAGANNAATSNEGSEDYYSKLSQIIGPKGLLLLTATQPKAYEEPGVIGDIPGIRQDQKYRSSDLLAKVMEERGKINPNALNILDNFYNSLTPEDASDVNFIHSYGGVKTPDRWQSIIDTKLAGSQQVNLNDSTSQ